MEEKLSSTFNLKVRRKFRVLVVELLAALTLPKNKLVTILSLLAYAVRQIQIVLALTNLTSHERSDSLVLGSALETTVFGACVAAVLVLAVVVQAISSLLNRGRVLAALSRWLISVGCLLCETVLLVPATTYLLLVLFHSLDSASMLFRFSSLLVIAWAMFRTLFELDCSFQRGWWRRKSHNLVELVIVSSVFIQAFVTSLPFNEQLNLVLGGLVTGRVLYKLWWYQPFSCWWVTILESSGWVACLIYSGARFIELTIKGMELHLFVYLGAPLALLMYTYCVYRRKEQFLVLPVTNVFEFEQKLRAQIENGDSVDSVQAFFDYWTPRFGCCKLMLLWEGVFYRDIVRNIEVAMNRFIALETFEESTLKAMSQSRQLLSSQSLAGMTYLARRLLLDCCRPSARVIEYDTYSHFERNSKKLLDTLKLFVSLREPTWDSATKYAITAEDLLNTLRSCTTLEHFGNSKGRVLGEALLAFRPLLTHTDLTDVMLALTRDRSVAGFAVLSGETEDFGTIVHASLDRLLGFSLTDLVGIHFAKLIVKSSVSRVASALSKLLLFKHSAVIELDSLCLHSKLRDIERVSIQISVSFWDQRAFFVIEACLSRLEGRAVALVENQGIAIGPASLQTQLSHMCDGNAAFRRLGSLRKACKQYCCDFIHNDFQDIQVVFDLRGIESTYVPRVTTQEATVSNTTEPVRVPRLDLRRISRRLVCFSLLAVLVCLVSGITYLVIMGEFNDKSSYSTYIVNVGWLRFYTVKCMNLSRVLQLFDDGYKFNYPREHYQRELAGAGHSMRTLFELLTEEQNDLSSIFQASEVQVTNRLGNQLSSENILLSEALRRVYSFAEQFSTAASVSVSDDEFYYLYRNAPAEIMKSLNATNNMLALRASEIYDGYYYQTSFCGLLLIVPLFIVALGGVWLMLKFHWLSERSVAIYEGIKHEQKAEAFNIYNDILQGDGTDAETDIPLRTKLSRSKKSLCIVVATWFVLLSCSAIVFTVLELYLHKELTSFLTEAALYNQVGGLRRMVPILSHFWIREHFLLTDSANSYLTLLSENSYYASPSIEAMLSVEYLRMINRQLFYEYESGDMIEELMLGQLVPHGGLNANLIDYCNTVRTLLVKDSLTWQEVAELEEYSESLSVHYIDLLNLYYDIEAETRETIWAQILCGVLILMVLSVGTSSVAVKVVWKRRYQALALVNISTLIASAKSEVDNPT